MTKFQDWLTELGLEQYAEVLVENDIDFDIISDLAESDFEKLGFSLGHRRKLLRALVERAHTLGLPQAATAVAPADPPATKEAERRQVTVMFCDLVGSTALANAIDPEDMSMLIRRYQDACAGAIVRFDGFIAKFMGDGVLAYFGYPQAYEDAAKRTILAALAIIENVAHLKTPEAQPVQVRIGIATGVVVIGDIIGTGTAREHAVVGETPNLAARLQALAEPDAILISQSTYSLLGRQFDYQRLGEHSLKGFANPVPVWRVLREASIASRFSAERTVGAASFVGRTQEVALILDRWQMAKQNEGQVVVLSGEPGMGKSRILDGVCERLGDETYYHLICQCSSYHTNSALHPIIRNLEHAAGFTPEDSPALKLQKLETMLSASNNFSETTALLLADLLSIPLGDRALTTPPAQRKAATIAALVNQITHIAEQRPTLLIFEDVHWIDPSTLELLTRLVDGIAASAVLIIITSRPEFVSPWSGRDHLSSLALSRLGKAQCIEMLTSIVAGWKLAPSLIEDILAKTDGVPLFVEELTKAVMESATPERPAVPATLHDSLMARLDRLGAAKEIAQVAAVIGKEFSLSLLEAVVPASAGDLATGLAKLVDAGLVFPHSKSSEAGYSFKHALVRDVAYDNLLRGRRQQIHERVARALAADFPATVEGEPELLAYHFGEAHLAELSCAYWERAGDRAVARSNFFEAVAHFRAGLVEARRLVDGADRWKIELELLLKSGPALTIIKGHQSPETEQTYLQAREIAAKLGDKNGLFKATWGLWLSANVGRKLEVARDRAQELVALGQHLDDTDLLLEAFHCRWSTAMFRGDVPTAIKDSLEGIERYDPVQHSWMGPVFGGHDPGVCAYGVQAIVLSQSGQFQRAAECIDQSLVLADKLGYPSSVGHALHNASTSCQMARDYAGVERYAQRLIELANKYNFPPHRANALFLNGWAQALGRNSEAGLEAMESIYDQAVAIGPFFRFYAVLLAEARAHFGKAAAALPILATAIGTITEPGIGFCVSELYRMQGICLLAVEPNHPEAAMTSLHQALATATQQKAPLFQLRAAISLVGAARFTGQAVQCMRTLHTLCANLPVGFDASELSKARQLLITK